MPRPPPPILLLKRRAMRMYPDNKGVALYYAEALGKHISIPFGGNDAIMAEGFAEDLHPAWDRILDDNFDMIHNHAEDKHTSHKEKMGHYNHMREIKSQHNDIRKKLGHNGPATLANRPITKRKKD